jgi:hypothetical protein
VADRFWRCVSNYFQFQRKFPWSSPP